LIDYTTEENKKRKDAMDTKLLPRSNATNVTNKNGDHAIIYYRSNIVQNDDPHKTELLLSKQSWNGVPLCTRWCGRHWEEIIAGSRGLHVWTLDRKKASIQSFV
jgi:hypothetical protein